MYTEDLIVMGIVTYHCTLDANFTELSNTANFPLNKSILKCIQSRSPLIHTTKVCL